MVDVRDVWTRTPAQLRMRRIILFRLDLPFTLFDPFIRVLKSECLFVVEQGPFRSAQSF